MKKLYLILLALILLFGAVSDEKEMHNDDIRLRHDRTVVGKFSDTTKTVVEYIPRQMVQSDVDALFWFFQLVTYKFIAQQYGGITLEYPSIDVTK